MTPVYPYFLGSIDALSEALEARDSHTREHCGRLVRLATEFANVCGVVDAEIDLLRICARFHDIGKIGVPDAVLLKPGRLTDDEWVLMRSHSVIGERIFSATAIPHALQVGKIIRHHHESVDGSGYPDGLAGAEIPLLSRILLIVDAYDAMTSSRPYHAPKSHEQVLEIMKGETGRKFDADLMAKFLKMIDYSPARVS